MLNNNSFTDDITPLVFQLSQNYPNPFRERTTIKYCIPYRTRVKMTVYDETGEELENLIDEEEDSGTYEIEFKDVETKNAESMRHKLLVYVLEAGDYKCKKKMELIR